jgi:hypothetical protein
MHTRSERRAKKALMKVKAKRLFPSMEKPQILADNLQFCSCYMCGNPRRRWKEKTLKERQFITTPIEIE